MTQTVRGKLASLFNIESGEGRLVALMLAHSFFIGSARIFLRTAGYALFLVEHGAQALPYVYIGIGAVAALLSFAYLKLSERVSFSKLLLSNVGFLLLSLLGFRLGLGMTAARWLTFALPIWYEVLWTLTNLEFFGLAGRLFNVRQAKRLSGLIGAGGQVAIIVGGLLAPLVVALIGTPNLLLVAAASMAGVVISLLSTLRSYGDHLAGPTGRTPSEVEESSLSLVRSRYILLIFGLVVLIIVGYFVTDNILYAEAEVHYAGQDELASFIGIFFGLAGFLALLSRTLLTGQLLGRYGVRVALLFTPALLVVSGIAAAAAGTLFRSVAAFFWLTALVRLITAVLVESHDFSALKVLYQPLTAAQRVQAQTMVEGIIYSLAIGLTGLTLFALTSLFALGTVQLVYALVGVVLAWIAVAILLGRQYPKELVQALTGRRLGGAELSLTDASSLAVLQTALQSPHPGVAVYALNTLQAAGHESLPVLLQESLEHPAPQVRQDALQRIEQLGIGSALPAVRKRVGTEPVGAVRGAAVRTLAALGEGEVLEEVSDLLEDSEDSVRRGAMVGMLRSGGIAGVLAAGHKLLQMAQSPQGAERALAAQVLGEVGVQSFYQPLLPLLRDRDRQVERAALVAAGQVKNARLWPLVVEKLASPPVRSVAAAAMIAGGEPALPVVTAAFARAGQPREVLAQLVRICGRIGGDVASSWLKARLAYPDACIRTHILRALNRCGYQAQADEVAQVQEQVKAEAALSAETLAILLDIGDDEACGLLCVALNETLLQARERIFSLLSFIHDPRSILQARDNLQLASAEKRAYALEVIDVLVSPELKRMVLPLLSGTDAGQKLQQLRALFPQEARDRQQRLQEIIAAPPGPFTAWTQACALYAVGRLATDALGETVVAALSAPEPLVRETAIWTLSKLDGARYRSQVDALREDPSPQVARAAQHL
jgi:AAA family ATP:ADP antiporter